MTVAVVGNPTSNKGRGAKTGEQVIGLLQSAGDRHGFEVIDVTGTSFEDSLVKAKSRRDEYDYLVVVGGDGMIALGTNAVGCSGKPLGIVVRISTWTWVWSHRCQVAMRSIPAPVTNCRECRKQPSPHIPYEAFWPLIRCNRTWDWISPTNT